MSKNKNMHAAKKNKNDELYTMLTDIEKEIEVVGNIMGNIVGNIHDNRKDD